MASLLSKFRIDYSDLTIFSGLTKKCQEETMSFYESLVKDFVTNSKDDAADAGESKKSFLRVVAYHMNDLKIMLFSFFQRLPLVKVI